MKVGTNLDQIICLFTTVSEKISIPDEKHKKNPVIRVLKKYQFEYNSDVKNF
jgi:hypothetical protein